MTTKKELPVPILKYPHWRVNFRPESYEPELIPTLSECYKIVEQTKVSLRGWDYPHLSNRADEREQGNNWVSSWSNFMGHYEYWRLYQSGQFLHLFSVHEASEPLWRSRLEQVTRSHLDGIANIDWSKVPGFISILNFLYNMTEIYEFAARLVQKGLYKGLVSIKIEVKGIKGFVLTTEWDRGWYEYYAATENELGKTWAIQSSDLISASAEHSLNAVCWFFERFGWLEPNVPVLKKDQEKFLKRQL